MISPEVVRFAGSVSVEPFREDISARELEVLKCAAEGCTCVKTGKRLFISEETVKTHRRRAISKTGTSGMPSAIDAVIKSGDMRVDPGEPGRRPLSAREVEVLLLVAQGKNNMEIGEELFISAETVKSHIRHILEALEARSRAQAVYRAYQTGDFELPLAQLSTDQLKLLLARYTTPALP